jgi:hypothetical protein
VIEEVVAVRRRLAGVNAAAYETDLELSLHNRSVMLGRYRRGSPEIAA